MERYTVIVFAILAFIYTMPLHSAPSFMATNVNEVLSPERSPSETSTMKIRLTIDGRSLTATLVDNPTTRDFLNLLPITLTVEDYAGTEKIAYLPRKLSEEDAPAGIDPEVGDLTYYAPWGNLALFYKDFGYAKGLIKLGHIDENAEAFDVPDSVKLTIEVLSN